MRETTAPIGIPAGSHDRTRPDIDSFYHLRDGDLSGRTCDGTACFVARNSHGPPRPARAADDPRVYCLGRCFEAPVTGIALSRPHVEIHSAEPVLLRNVARGGVRSIETYRADGGYTALERALAGCPSDLLDAVEQSGLRGRGGAGFPTGRKWRAAAAQVARPKYLVANGDEGDAGAFMDRSLMEDDPFRLIEGMTLAAYAVGASRGWIYLRREYPLAKEILEAALAEACAAQLLGPDILGTAFEFNIEVSLGYGSYVCGEETAMIRSIEGMRPEVVARPPYTAECGLFGKPTVVNNVETLAAVPWIVENGSQAYQALGFSRSRGTKAISLNSLFTKPGLYEIEFGVPLRRIVEDYGGGLRTGRIAGLLVGGPIAGIVPPALFDTPFGFEEMAAIGASVGHGGMIAFDENTSIADLVRHVFSFGAYESCGKCTPCRLGSRRLENLLARAATGHPLSEEEQSEWRDVVSTLQRTSLCGHGTGLGDFAASAIRYYGKELEQCLV